MFRIVTSLLCCVLLSGCATDEMRMEDAISAYLKSRDILVEEVSILKADPMTKNRYAAIALRELMLDSNPFSHVPYLVAGKVPDSMNKYVDSVMEFHSKLEKKWRDMEQEIAAQDDRDEFAYIVTALCKCTGRGNKSKTAQIEFLYCKYVDMEVVMRGDDKFLKQWSK